jgi:ribosome-associated protein
MSSAVSRAPRAQTPSATVPVRLPITLGQFLKLAGLAASGGEAKSLVGEGRAWVNGATETRRGRKLQPGDVVEVDGRMAEVVAESGGGHHSSEG